MQFEASSDFPRFTQLIMLKRFTVKYGLRSCGLSFKICIGLIVVERKQECQVSKDGCWRKENANMEKNRLNVSIAIARAPAHGRSRRDDLDGALRHRCESTGYIHYPPFPIMFI